MKEKVPEYVRFFTRGYVIKYDINFTLVIGGVVVGSVFYAVLLLKEYYIVSGLTYFFSILFGSFLAWMHKKKWSLTKFWFNSMSFLWGTHLVPFVWLIIWIIFYIIVPFLSLGQT